MGDYGQMRAAIRRVHEEWTPLDGYPCPTPSCQGTLSRENGRLVCSHCDS